MKGKSFIFLNEPASITSLTLYRALCINPDSLFLNPSCRTDSTVLSFKHYTRGNISAKMNPSPPPTSFYTAARLNSPGGACVFLAFSTLLCAPQPLHLPLLSAPLSSLIFISIFLLASRQMRRISSGDRRRHIFLSHAHPPLPHPPPYPNHPHICLHVAGR